MSNGLRNDTEISDRLTPKQEAWHTSKTIQDTINTEGLEMIHWNDKSEVDLLAKCEWRSVVIARESSIE